MWLQEVPQGGKSFILELLTVILIFFCLILVALKIKI